MTGEVTREELAWRATSMAAGVGAGLAVRAVLGAAWRRVAGSDPPHNPAERETTWGSALLWATALGIAAGVARVVSVRLAATAWERITDSPPPGLEVAGSNP